MATSYAKGSKAKMGSPVRSRFSCCCDSDLRNLRCRGCRQHLRIGLESADIDPHLSVSEEQLNDIVVKRAKDEVRPCPIGRQLSVGAEVVCFV